MLGTVHVPRHNYMKNTKRNTGTSTLTVTLLNKIERVRRIVTAITVVPKEAWVPFGFNCFYHRQLLVLHIHYCHTDYQLHKSCDSQTWYTFFCSNSYRFYTYTPDIPICHCVCEVHGLWMPWQFSLFFFEFSDQPDENTQCYFSVGLPRTVCAFVSLILDNILQQYVPRNTVAKFYSNCFLLLLWKISDQMYHWTWLHPWSATNSA